MAKKRSKRRRSKRDDSAARRSASTKPATGAFDEHVVAAINHFAELALELIQDAGPDPTAKIQELEHRLAVLVCTNQGPLPDQAVRSVLRELVSGAMAVASPLRVAFLGPEQTYSHLAVLERFGQSVELIPVASIAAVFEEVHARQATFGVVPIENSTDGRIADTLEMFTRLPVRICGEVQLRIHHNLLGRGPRSEVREVYSKPQALSQCRNWLARHLPAARAIEITSTAAAAQLALEKPTAAAISGAQAAAHFGLDILAANIEDNPSNVTRFAVIGEHAAPRTGRDKTALMFELDHKPGTLADALTVLKRGRINMTWIESFPIPRPEGGYFFFAEIDGHETDSKVRRALERLGKRTSRLEILGTCPRTTPIG